MGSEGKRKIRLRRKTNTELFKLYDDDLALRHRSHDALEEAHRVLKHFQEFLGEYPPSPELATSFLARYTERKATTLYRYHSIVKSFMQWYGEPLSTKIRVPERLPDYIELDDIEKLKAAMRGKKTHKKVIGRNLLLIDLGLKAGLRRSELSALQVKDIDLVRNYLIVRQGKGMKDRIVDLTPILHQSLELYIKGKMPEERVFNLCPSTISGIIRWAAMKAGVSIHTHSLRHFFGQDLVDKGADLETVRRLMGHTNLKTTQQYIGRTDKQRRDAIDSLERPVNKESAAGISVSVEPHGYSTTPEELKNEIVELGSIAQSHDLPGITNKLKDITANLAGNKMNAVEVLQKLWGKLELGMSRNHFVEALTKYYPSINPGNEYFEAADSLLAELAFIQVIRSEQRRESGIRTSWDVTYWVLTDKGREVIRHIKDSD